MCSELLMSRTGWRILESADALFSFCVISYGLLLNVRMLNFVVLYVWSIVLPLTSGVLLPVVNIVPSHIYLEWLAVPYV